MPIAVTWQTTARRLPVGSWLPAQYTRAVQGGHLSVSPTGPRSTGIRGTVTVATVDKNLRTLI